MVFHQKCDQIKRQVLQYYVTEKLYYLVVLL